MIAPPIPRALLLAYAAPALPLALLGITLYVILPKSYAAACNLAAIAIAWRYPVDRATHAAVRAAIDARALGAPAAT